MPRAASRLWAARMKRGSAPSGACTIRRSAPRSDSVSIICRMSVMVAAMPKLSFDSAWPITALRANDKALRRAEAGKQQHALTDEAAARKGAAWRRVGRCAGAGGVCCHCGSGRRFLRRLPAARTGPAARKTRQRSVNHAADGIAHRIARSDAPGCTSSAPNAASTRATTWPGKHFRRRQSSCPCCPARDARDGNR